MNVFHVFIIYVMYSRKKMSNISHCFLGFEPAAIFLGAIGGAAVLLIVIYLCIKSDKCFCNVQKDDGKETPDPEYARVASEDSGSEIPDDATTSGKLKGAKYVQSTGDLTEHPVLSSDDEVMAPGVAKIGEVVSDTESKISEQFSLPVKKSKKNKPTRSQSLESVKKGLGNLQLTLQYSKKDLFLFIVIHKINGFLPDEFPGVEHVRISMVLLPAKKYRSKTKFVSVGDEPEFGASFKFSNVSRADLFRSAMRFRLYGRHVKLGMQMGKEKLLGEVTVHLADVAQRERTTTSRPFAIATK